MVTRFAWKRITQSPPLDRVTRQRNQDLPAGGVQIENSKPRGCGEPAEFVAGPLSEMPERHDTLAGGIG
jgi:hypothetical protein